MENCKNILDSRTEHVQIVFSEYINGCGRLFGGKLVEWMDTIAAVVARRHSEKEVTTASIDKVDFAVPAKINDTIFMVGQILSVGNTSMRVEIKAYVEKLNGDRILINTAHFVMVALDDNNNPCRVPRIKE
jgi:acyl-CoA hydrolase